MIDFIQALRGPNHCSWCRTKPENWIERRYGGYKEENSPFGNLIWWLYLHAGLGSWRMGRMVHYRFHDEGWF